MMVDVDSSDKYLHKRRKAIGRYMGKKDVKEEKCGTDMKDEKKDKKKSKKDMKFNFSKKEDDDDKEENGNGDMSEMFSELDAIFEKLIHGNDTELRWMFLNI